MKLGYSFDSLVKYVEDIDKTTVKLTGAQTIAGIKTFSDIPLSTQTPALFANNTQLANTEFVQRALGNHQNAQFLSGLSNMSASAFGKVFWAGNTTAYDINLPSLAVSPAQGGGVIEIFCTNSAGVTIKATGTDNILVNATGVKQLTIKAGESLKLVSSLANGVYIAYGEAQLKYASSFEASLTAPGFQRLPSGLLIQFGRTPDSQQNDIAVAFKTTFPTKVVSITFGNDTVGGQNCHVRTLTSFDTTGFTYACKQAGTSQNIAGYGADYIAIGY